MLRLLGKRNVSLLWWGGLVSMLGNWSLIIALPVYIYQETGSTLATSLMFAAGTLPRVLCASAAGVFVDRLERKRTMVVCNLLLALAVIPLLFVSGSGTFGLIYMVSLVQATIGLFFGPAENAFLPSLVPRDDLIPANALNALNNNLARLIGPAIGGIIVSRFGLAGVVVFDLASYLVAAACISLIPTPAKTGCEALNVQTGASPKVSPGWVSEWREGLAQLRHTRLLNVVLCAMTLAAFGEGAFSVLIAPFVHEAFSGSALEFGWVMSAQAVGGIVGGLLVGWLRHIPPERLFALGLLYLGLIDLVLFNYAALVPSIVPMLVLMVVVGAPATAIGAGYTALLQTSLEDRFLGRVFGLVDAVSALALLVGTVAAGVLGDLVGVTTLVKVQGSAHALAGLLVLAGLKFTAKPLPM